MNNKEFIRLVFVLGSVFILLSIIVNFVIDPFQQYRKPTLYKTFYSGNERALNPGLAKNHDYKSVVIGSSMTENFLISKVNEIAPDAIKLPISAGSAYEHALLLNTVFKTSKKIDTVVIGLDIYAVFGKVDRLDYGEGSVPFYLYDTNYFNDIFYLANFDTLKESVKVFTRKYTHKDSPNLNYENMYQWQHLYENDFGKKKVLALEEKYKEDKKFLKSDYSFENLNNSFDYNFLSIVQNNPNIKFIFFYPPYSILEYRRWYKNGTLEDILKFKKHVISQLGILNNVEVYDFHSASEITTNLDNYKDFSHYHQNINHWIVDKIKEKKFLVTNQNIDEHLQNLREQIQNYDLNKSGIYSIQ